MLDGVPNGKSTELQGLLIAFIRGWRENELKHARGKKTLVQSKVVLKHTDREVFCALIFVIIGFGVSWQYESNI